MQKKKFALAFILTILFLTLALGEQYKTSIVMFRPGQEKIKISGTSAVEMTSSELENNSSLDSGQDSILSKVLTKYIWNTIFLAIPYYFCWCVFLFWKIRKKETTTEEKKRQEKLILLLRYVIGFALFWIILTFKKNFWNSLLLAYLGGFPVKYAYLRWILACVAFLIPVIEWKAFWRSLCNFPKVHPHLFKVVTMAIIPIFCMYLTELQLTSKMDILEDIYIYHYLYWVIFEIVLYLAFWRIRVSIVCPLICSWIIGFANSLVLQFRGNYIMYGDILAVGTALEVVNHYTFHPDMYFWITLILLLVSCMLIWKLPYSKEKKRSWKQKFLCLLLEMGLLTGVVTLFWNGTLYGHINGLAWDYNTNVANVGYLPYFFSNMRCQQKVECEDYSPQGAEKAVEEITDSKIESNTKQEPNIILIQNEAFADLSKVYDLQTDQDVMPYFHSLKKNTIKGYLNMSVTGGPTSDTEYEVLTRATLGFLPYGCVPYTQYLKEHIPSLVEALKNQEVPYNTFSYHSYYSSGYNRKSAYNYLGFEKSIFEDNFMEEYEEKDLPRGYLSDEANYKKVLELYEQAKKEKPDQPVFCFNVTVQNHGGYEEKYIFEDSVKVTNFEATDSIQTYLSLLKMSDSAFEQIVDYFSNIEEPTIIMMYGDHQPAFDDEAQELLDEHPITQDEEQQKLNHYYVPYIIWANYDLGEEENNINTLSTNYIGSILMKYAGVELSLYDQYLLFIQKKIPALTALGYWTDHGDYYQIGEGPEQELLNGLQKVQYNLLFDDKEKLDIYLPFVNSKTD